VRSKSLCDATAFVGDVALRSSTICSHRRLKSFEKLRAGLAVTCATTKSTMPSSLNHALYSVILPARLLRVLHPLRHRISPVLARILLHDPFHIVGSILVIFLTVLTIILHTILICLGQ
jgi:hypothetical protein